MNMNPIMLLLLFADKGKGKSRAGAVEAMLTASNQIPEAPRTLLAVTQATDQADRQEQQQQAVAKREEALAKLFVDIVKNKLEGSVPEDIGKTLLADSRVQFMLGKLSDQTLKNQVIELLEGSAAPTAGARATRTGDSTKEKLPTGKP